MGGHAAGVGLARLLLKEPVDPLMLLLHVAEIGFRGAVAFQRACELEGNLREVCLGGFEALGRIKMLKVFGLLVGPKGRRE